MVLSRWLCCLVVVAACAKRAPLRLQCAPTTSLSCACNTGAMGEIDCLGECICATPTDTPLVVTPDNVTLRVNEPQQFVATGGTTDGAPPSVTWTLADATDDASLSPAGLFVSKVPGSYDVVATMQGGDPLAPSVAHATVTVRGDMELITGAIGGYGSADGDPPEARFYYPTSVAITPSGTLYVGDGHRVRKIEANGRVSSIAGAYDENGDANAAPGEASSARFGGDVSVAADGADNVYISDRNNHKIKKIAANGSVTTLAGTGMAGCGGAVGTSVAADAALFSYVNAIELAPDGQSLYMVDGACNQVRKLSLEPTPTVTTIVGSGGSTGTTGPCTSAVLHGPAGIAVQANAANDVTLYVSTTHVDDNRICAVRINGTSCDVSVYAGAPEPMLQNGSPQDARFMSLWGLDLLPTGGLLAVESGDDTIRRITNSSVSVLAGAWNTPGSQDGPLSEARFQVPLDIAVSRDGTQAFVADYFNTTIRKIDLLNGLVSTFAGSAPNAPGPSYVDGALAAARLTSPVDMARDALGNLLVLEQSGATARLRKVAFGGQVTTFVTVEGRSPPAFAVSAENTVLMPMWDWIQLYTAAGVTGATIGPAIVETGTGASRTLSPIADIALDAAGDAYVVQHDGRVDKIVLSGAVPTVTHIAGTGATDVFDTPTSIALDAVGNIYIADTNNHVIRKIDGTTRALRTIAGVSGMSGYTDGPLGTARLTRPSHLAIGPHGDLYFSDAQHTIRRVNHAVDENNITVATVLGSPSAIRQTVRLGAAPGILIEPRALTFDATGQLYFSTENAIIRYR